MKYGVTLFLLVVLIVGGVWYTRETAVCPVPLHYQLGSLDEQFNLSEAEAIDHIRAAETVWEAATGRELFVYDETADFTIDFTFDERQALADSEEANRTQLDSAQEQNEELRQTIAALQAEYEELSTNFEARREVYEADLAAYNSKVQQYNDRGGAPKEVYTALAEERDGLNATAQSIGVTADELNELAADLNRLSAEGNRRISTYNEEVNTYNDQFGFVREFTQGDYQRDNINIYKFSDTVELERVLVHEFGHALGIGHVEGTSSVMYYLLEEPAQPPVLTSDDLAAVVAVCGTGDELRYKLRAWVQSLPLFSN